MSGASILIVEDDAEIAEFLRAGLTTEGYLVETVPDGQDLVQKVAAQGFSVVILDRMLPDAEGAELCQALRATGVDCMILMLTAKDSLDDKLEGLRSGADDYMTKPFAFAELLARIEALLRRRAPDARSPEELVVADLRLDLRRKLAYRGERELGLTATEFALLGFLAKNEGRTVGRMEILNAVWGYDFDPHTNIVEVYIAYLRRKIDRPGEPALIRNARGFGYYLAIEGGTGRR